MIRSIPARHSRLRCGWARADITPPVGIYHRMWGAARHDRATGVHRPLAADVLALGPLGSDEVGLLRVCLDLVGLGSGQHEDLARFLARACGLPRDRLVLTYSHTHSGGWFAPNRIPLPGGELIPGYLAQLQERLQEAGALACSRLQEVLVTYGTGSCRMAASRDCWDDEYQGYVCGFNPEGEADDTVVVARVIDPQGRLVLDLVNYACHPTTLAWENTLISPDYVGAMREEVEWATGAPCVFAQGPCGDLGPRDGFVGDVAVADRNGRHLAHAALAALEAMGPPGTDFQYQGPVVSGATLGTWAHVPIGAERLARAAVFSGGTYEVDLPLKSGLDRQTFQAELDKWQAQEQEALARGDRLAARNCGARAERARRWLGRLVDLPQGDSYPLRFSVHRLGEAVWVASGGEPYSLLQVELRRRFPDWALVVSPLAGNMQVAYLLSADRYGKGLYQEEPSCLGPGCLEKLIEAVAGRIAPLLG